MPPVSTAALLLIVVINDFDFPDAEKFLRFAAPTAAGFGRSAGAVEPAQLHLKIAGLKFAGMFGVWLRTTIAHFLLTALKRRTTTVPLKEYFSPSGPTSGRGTILLRSHAGISLE